MQTMVDELVDLALEKGGEDNITVQLVGNDYTSRRRSDTYCRITTCGPGRQRASVTAKSGSYYAERGRIKTCAFFLRLKYGKSDAMQETSRPKYAPET